MSQFQHGSDNVPMAQPPMAGGRSVSPVYLDAEWQPAAAAPANSGLHNYLHAFRRRWLVSIVLGVVCAVVAAAAAWFLYVPKYTATAMLRVAAKQESILPGSPLGRQDYSLYKATQQQYLASQFVLMAALRQPEVAQLPSVQQEPDPARWLSENLTVRFPGDAEIMNVSVSSENAQEAAALANAVVDAYMQEVVDAELRQQRERLGELDTLYAETQAELRTLENNLKELAQQLETTDSQALTLKQQITLQQFATYRSELASVQVKLMRLQGQLALKESIRERMAKSAVTEADVDAAAQSDRVMIELAMRQNQLEAQIARNEELVRSDMAARYNRRYQDELKEIERQRELRRAALKEQLAENRVGSLDEDIEQLKFEMAVLQQQEKQLQAEVDKTRQVAEQFGVKSIEVEIMRSEKDSVEQTFKMIADERRRLQIELQRSKPRIEVIQKASRPRVADQDRQIQLAVLAGLGGLAFPIAGILWWDTRGKRVNTPGEVSDTTGIDVLGTVPLVPARAAKHLNSDGRRFQHWKAIFAESVRGIAARLLRQGEEDQVRVVLVTSAFGGEGKTTVASQLAISLAQMGQRTVVVDFDLRRPSLDGVFGVENTRGVSEVLRGETTWEESVVSTGMENLDLIPAGHWTHRGLAVLANGVVGGMFSQLRQRYDFVIVDGSPVLPMADTRFVSTHVDGVVMSVLRDVSRMPKVAAAYRTLAAFRANILGAIVTGSPEEAYYYDPRYTSYLNAEIDSQTPAESAS